LTTFKNAKMRNWIITENDLHEARHWFDFHDNDFTVNKKSYYKLYGALAEMKYCESNDCERISQHDYQADFILPNKLRIDVKCTAQDFDYNQYCCVKVQANQRKFNVDVYHFFWYNFEKKILTELGYMDKKLYFEMATFRKKGEFFPKSKIVVKEDMYDLEISKIPIKFAISVI